MKDEKPFDQLSETDQRNAIDIACAVSLMITRLPGLPDEWMDTIIEEFAMYHGLPKNLSKYALRQIGQQLFKHSWHWNVTKETNATIGTYFKQGEPVINSEEGLSN